MHLHHTVLYDEPSAHHALTSSPAKMFLNPYHNMHTLPQYTQCISHNHLQILNLRPWFNDNNTMSARERERECYKVYELNPSETITNEKFIFHFNLNFSIISLFDSMSSTTLAVDVLYTTMNCLPLGIHVLSYTSIQYHTSQWALKITHSNMSVDVGAHVFKVSDYDFHGRINGVKHESYLYW